MYYFTDHKTISQIQSHTHHTVTRRELADKPYQDSYSTDKKTKVQISLGLAKGHHLLTKEPELKPFRANRLSSYISFITSLIESES